MHISELCERAYQQSKDKGFHDGEYNVAEKLALIHSEISEALEEHRAGHKPNEVYYNGEKPEGFGVELADAVIRICDLAGKEDIDLEALISEKLAYNARRPHKHGKGY